MRAWRKKSFLAYRIFCHKLTKLRRKRFIFLILLFVFSLLGVNVFNASVSAKSSTIDVTVPPDISLTKSTTAVSSNGTFLSTNTGTVQIKTDNYTGYTLGIKAGTTGTNATNLVNSSDNTKTITSIASAITSDAFSGVNGTSYNNKWGYLPSKFNSQNNTSYRPAPSTSGDTIDTTSAANTSYNSYSFTVGARVDSGTKAGTYTGTILVVPVANPVAYAITYNSNTTASVTNMPSNVSSTTPSETIILSSNTPTRAGYTFAGWNTKSDGTGTNYSAGGTWTLDQTASSNTLTLYAKWTPKTYTATIYYNNKTSSGTVGTTNITNTGSTVQCTVANVAGTCSPTIPTTVTSSVGTYNNAYVGLASSTSTMSSTTSITLSGNATFYAVYGSSVEIVNPTSTSAASKTIVYRNQWFTSNSALSSTVLSTTTTGTTTNYSQTSTVATDYSFAGYAEAASNNNISSACYSSGTTAASCTTVARLTLSALTKAWAVYNKSVTLTFYYNNNTSDTTYKAPAVTSTTTSATQYLRPTSDSAAGLSNPSVSVPSAVSSSKGAHGENYLNVGTSTENMTAITPSAAATTYYARYSDEITMYKPHSSVGYITGVAYRNQRVTGASATSMSSSVLGVTNTSTSNSTYTAGVGDSLCGFNASINSSTCTYASYSAAATSNVVYSALYAIENQSVSATFYYNNGAATSCATSIASTTNSGTRKYYIISSTQSASSLGTVEGSIAIPSAVSNSYGPYCNKYTGVAGSTSSMTSASPSTGATTYYAFYGGNDASSKITLYYPSSTSVRTSTNLYRNSFFTSTTGMNTVATSTITGTANYSPSTPVTNYSIVGYATSTGTNTSSFANIAAIATDTNHGLTYYMILSKSVTATFYYNNNTTPTAGTSSVTSTTKSATQYIHVTTSAAEISNSSYSAPSGHYGTYNNALAGWATSTGTMSTVTPNTSATTFYAVYRANVTNYYYTGSAYSSRTLYRNQTLSSTSAMDATYLSTSTTGLSNYATANGPGSSTFFGYSTSLSSTAVAQNCGAYGTAPCGSVANAAASTNITLNTIYRFTQLFSLNGSTGVTAIGSTSVHCAVSSTSSTAGGTSCTVTTPTISVDTGYTSLGWGTQGHTTQGTAAGATITLTTSGGTPLYANAKLSTYNLVITGDGNITSMAVKQGSTSGTQTNCTKSGNTFTCAGLTYDTNYYLFPTFIDGYIFSSWAKTDSATNSALSSTSTENAYYTMGAGAGALTLTSRTNCAANMQSISLTNLNSLMPNTGSTAILCDNRDNKPYVISKLEDGNYWMQSNLNLAGGTTLTSDNTDFDSSYTLPTNQGWQSNGKLPASSSSGFSSANYAYVYNSGSVDCGDNSPCYSYYSWDVATVGSGRSLSTNNTNAPYSVCPKGWRLPTTTTATTDSSTDFRKLMVSYGGAADISSYTSSTSPTGATIYGNIGPGTDLNLKLGGYYNSSKLNYGGQFGYYWTSTSYSSTTYARSLTIGPSEVKAANYGYRRSGFAIRCIANKTQIMQETSESDLQSLLPNAGDTVTLKDARDGEEYLVGKLADGNYWMLDNLRLDLTNSSTIANTTADNTNATAYALDKLKNGGGSTADRYAVTGLTGSNWTKGISYSAPLVNASYKNTTAATIVGAGSGKVGVYYNYCAASAGAYCMGNGTSPGTPYINNAEDICPKGWRLPTGSNSGEYQGLYYAYGSNRTNLAEALSESQTGDFYNTNTTDYTMARGTANTYHWTSTRYDNSQIYRTRNYTSDGLTNASRTRYIGSTVRCIFDQGTIQDQTPATMDSHMTTSNTIASFRDSRDIEPYLVTKLADGNYWFLDNLRLDLTIASVLSGTTADNTNATSTSLTRLKSGGGTTSDRYPTAKINNVSWTSASQNYYSIPMAVATYKDTVASTTYGKGSGRIGLYYNFCAATAGSYCYGNGTSAGTSSGNATEDLCPTGWRLPTGNTSGEYQSLYSAYSSNATNFKNALSTSLTGYFNSGSKATDSYADWWSSTRSSTEGKVYMLNAGASQLLPNHQDYRYYGLTIRCVKDNSSVSTIMQEVTSQGLAAMMPSEGSTTTLTDSRDGNNYTIVRINGKYWMADNLRITGTITAAGSNFSGSNFNTSAGGDLASSSRSDTTPQSHPASGKTGAWYNYCAATAGQVCSDVTNFTATQDICPAGWRLPNNTGNKTGGEVYDLAATLRSNSTLKTAFSLVYGGSYYGGSPYDPSTFATWWSSTTGSDDYRAYYLRYESGDLRTGYYVRDSGRYIRCVKQ